MIENRITQKIREASKAIITGISDAGKQSVRKLAERIGRSKSSAHRHLKAIKKRDQHPESSQWETEVGSAWLRLMFFSTLYQFGLKSGVGADSLSEFFTLVRVETHIGVSPSAIRTQLNEMERLLPEFQAECEKQISDQSREVVAGMDETFFGQFIILVLMDLRSGYLLLEDITAHRSPNFFQFGRFMAFIRKNRRNSIFFLHFSTVFKVTAKNPRETVIKQSNLINFHNKPLYLVVSNLFNHKLKWANGE